MAAHAADDAMPRARLAKAAVVDEARERAGVVALPERPAPSPVKVAADAARVERACQGLSTIWDDHLRVLSSRIALAQLHGEIAAHRAHPDWWSTPEARAKVEAQVVSTPIGPPGAFDRAAAFRPGRARMADDIPALRRIRLGPHDRSSAFSAERHRPSFCRIKYMQEHG